MRVAPPPPAAVDSPLNTADGTGQEYGGHVTRGAFALLSAQPLTWAISLASAVLVPRYLGDAGLGAYAVAWTIGVFVGTLVTFGLPSVLTRKVASQPALSATYAGGGVVIVTAFAIPISLALFVVIGAGGRGGIDLALVSLGVATAVVLSVQSVLMAVLVGLGRNARYAWSLAAAGVFTTVVGLATLAVGGDAHGFAVAIFSSWAISTLVLWRTSGLRFTRAALAPALLRELAVGGLPFLGWNIALRVRADIDVVLVGVLLQSNVAGWLAAAYRIINITVFIPTVITTPLLPALTRAKRQPEAYRSLLGDSLATVLLLTVPVSASVFVLAPVIPSLLGWPDSLQQAIPPMMILAFQQPLVGVDMVLGTGLMALGLERRWLGVAAAAAVFNPVLNLAAIPLTQALVGNGAVGAAVVELATESVFLVGALYLTPRGLLGRADLGRAARTIGAGVVFLAVATMVRPLGPAVALGAGGMSYLAVAVALGILRPRQLRAVRQALRAA